MTKPNAFPALHAPEGGYVFVVTYGRSGSTLTQNLLNSIPGYCIRGENGNILYHLLRAVMVTRNDEMYQWRREDMKNPVEERRPYLKGILGRPVDPWYGVEEVSPQDFAAGLAETFAQQILRIPPETRVAGFKEIRWFEDRRFFTTYLRLLREIFPNTRFLFQTRGAEQVSHSSWWKNKDPKVVFEMVEAANAAFHGYCAENADHAFLIEYERYAEGVDYVRGIFDFLKEDFEAETVAHVLNSRLSH